MRDRADADTRDPYRDMAVREDLETVVSWYIDLARRDVQEHVIPRAQVVRFLAPAVVCGGQLMHVTTQPNRRDVAVRVVVLGDGDQAAIGGYTYVGHVVQNGDVFHVFAQHFMLNTFSDAAP